MKCPKCEKDGLPDGVWQLPKGGLGTIACAKCGAQFGFAVNETVDPVDHPQHYQGHFECISAMEDCYGQQAVKDFCLLNAFKYLWRCKQKHESPVEDIKKAIWYLQKYVELAENK